MLRTTQDLEQYRNSRGCEGNTIDVELKGRSVLILCKTMCVKSGG